jgi:hypothetical protein
LSISTFIGSDPTQLLHENTLDQASFVYINILCITAGNESPIIGAILRKKRTTKRKVVPQVTADMPVGTNPEPIISAQVEEEKADEGVSNVVGPKKKKQKVPATAVRRSNRPRA